MQVGSTRPDIRVPRPTAGLALAILVASLLAAVLPYALKLGADRDLWWHVRTGQMILDQRGLPDTDPFSFTANRAPWTNHEWLADVVAGGIFSAAGDVGLSVWRIVLLFSVVGTFALALRRRFDHPAFLLATLLLTVPLIRIFINLRPHGYTYLLALVLISILDTAVRRPRVLWIIPPLMVLWTNLHGGFLLGLALAICGLGIHALGIDHGSADRPSRRDWRRCGLVGLLTVAAPTINPHGFGLFPYLVSELGAKHTLILEWYGIWHFPDQRLAYVLLLAVPLVALACAGHLRPRLPRGMALPLGFWMLSAWATYRHGRFLVLLVIFASLVTYAALPDILDRLTRRRPLPLLERLRSPAWLVGLAAIPLAAGIAQFAVDYQRKGLRLSINPTGLPVMATEFLKQHELGPNLLLRLDWGGYAIWHLFPDYRVSADGRNLTVYDEDFVNAQLLAYDRGEFAQYFRGYDVDTILVESAGPTYMELRRNRDWMQVYEDQQAAVFVPPDVGRSLAQRRRPVHEARPAAERFFFP